MTSHLTRFDLSQRMRVELMSLLTLLLQDYWTLGVPVCVGQRVRLQASVRRGGDAH